MALKIELVYKHLFCCSERAIIAIVNDNFSNVLILDTFYVINSHNLCFLVALRIFFFAVFTLARDSFRHEFTSAKTN